MVWGRVAMGWQCNIIEKSKYKNVYKVQLKEKIWFRANVFKTQKYFETEREAAIYVDKQYLSKGKQPVNILVRKK